MRTLSRYLVRRALAYFALGVVIVLASLALERLMRLVEQVTNEGAPLSAALEVLAYLLPHYLELAVPAALFLGVLFAVRRLHAASELMPVLAAGVPVRRVTRVMTALGLGLTVITVLNAAYVQPFSRHAYRVKLNEVTRTALALGLQPGVFREINDNLVVRADGVSEGGRVLTGFFAEARRPEGRTYVIARKAQLARTEAGDLVIKLRDGSLVRTGDVAESDTRGDLTFSGYTWEPPVSDPGVYGPRGQDAREHTLIELIAGGAPSGTPPPAPDRATELHSRLVHAVSLAPLAILAVPLALLGRGRTGRAYGVGVGVVLLVLYQKVLSFGETFAMQGVLPAAPAMWVPFLVLTAGAVIWALTLSEGGVRGALAWMLHPRRPPYGEG